MWTPEDRRLVGAYGAGQALSDDQYRLIEPLGCQWRHLPPPPAFPPWQTVYRYFRAFLEAAGCGRACAIIWW